MKDLLKNALSIVFIKQQHKTPLKHTELMAVLRYYRASFSPIFKYFLPNSRHFYMDYILRFTINRTPYDQIKQEIIGVQGVFEKKIQHKKVKREVLDELIDSVTEFYTIQKGLPEFFNLPHKHLDQVPDFPQDELLAEMRRLLGVFIEEAQRQNHSIKRRKREDPRSLETVIKHLEERVRELKGEERDDSTPSPG